MAAQQQPTRALRRRSILAFMCFAVIACGSQSPTVPSASVSSSVPSESAPTTTASTGAETRRSIVGKVTTTFPVAGTPVSGAKIEITGGASVGIQTQTNDSGEFTLSNVTLDAFDLQTSKNGYLTRLSRVASDASGALTVQLDPPPPPVSNLTVRIDGSGSKTAILGYSPIRYSAASTNDQNTYRIDFDEDGTSYAGPSVIHQCTDNGIHKIRLTVTDPIGQTSTASVAQPLCINLVWYYGWLTRVALPGYALPPLVKLLFETRTGSSLTGFFLMETKGVQPFTATLSGDRNIQIVLNDGSTLTGTVILDTTYDGVHADREIIVTARGGILDGSNVKFSYYDPF
jgi:hypothetical protein